MKSTELALKEATIVQERRMPSPIEILEAAVKGGITTENMAVVKELREMVRDEQNAQAKKAFNRDFFELKQDINKMQLCADREAKDRSGNVTYVYCSEAEISRQLEPLLSKHGFATMFGQRQDCERTVAILTLIHREGHEETREYAVRGGKTNAMKDETAVDAGATTTAWRHLVTKFFGLKSRIREDDDARNIGEHITVEQADALHRRVETCGADKEAFLRFAGASSFDSIPALRLPELEKMLAKKEAARKPKEEKNEDGTYRF